MARIQQDQFIDEDEEEDVCPLCVEEFDLGDKYFRPCQCGYQICQFCYNNIKTTMNGLCPACRRRYGDKPYSFKNVTQEELLQHEKNKAAQQKKKAAAKQKEAQKREADNLSRKHLAGLRVRQRNLVYVTGMRPKIQGDRVAELLRGKDYFGQYGDIIKVVVSKSKDAAHTPNQPVGIYVTFARKEDAAACIDAINSAAQTSDGKVRAQHGTTKYCSAYLRGEMCNNRNCMFLHEPGESAESFTRQDLSNMNAISTQQPSGPDDEVPQPPPQNAQPVAAAVQDTAPSSPSAPEGSALPPGAGWARRGSRTTSSSIASPVVMNTTPAPVNDRAAASDNKTSRDGSSESAPSRPPSSASAPKKAKKSLEQSAFDQILKIAFNPNMKFTFSPSGLSEEDIKLINSLPCLWDPQGGVKRRLMKQREAEELRKQEETQGALQEARSETAEQGEVERAGGSLQLGGEPEERPDRAFGQQSAIQPPGLPFGPQFSLDNDLANLSLRGNASAAQQHQSQLLRQLQTAGTGQHQIGGHGRHPSRFSFNESGGIKAGAGLQQPKNTGGFGPAGQQVPFYSGVQGPPPGLKTTGTPPVNGGSMFGQGHGFTAGLGYSAMDSRSAQSRVQDTTKLDLPALGQSIDPLRRSTPTIPPGLEQPRRATPTIPPGLFPHLRQSSGQNTAQPKEPTIETTNANNAATPVPVKKDPREEPQAPMAVVSTSSDIASIPNSKDKGKAPAVARPPTVGANIERDPTPAESMASKKTARQVSTKPPQQKQTAPETPAKSQKIAKEVISESTPPAQTVRALPSKLNETPSSASSKRPHPGKLNLDTTPDISKDFKKENDSPALPSASSRLDLSRSSRAPSVSAASLGSRPGTPLAGTVATGSPLKRTVQPRTLRITDTPKAETPPPLPVGPASTSAPLSVATSTPPPAVVPALPSLPAKIMSRRTSVASLNQPGTPATERTDTMSVTSTSVSRANSPPPAGPIVGKKSRKKDKVKKDKEAAVEAIIQAKEEAKEDIAPIMARKTKSKKSKKEAAVARPKQEPVIKEEKAEASSTAVVEPPKPGEVKVEESHTSGKAKSETPVQVPSTPTPREAPVQVEEPKESPGASPLTTAAILQDLERNYHFPLNTLNMFKPLASQAELKKVGMDPLTSADIQNHIKQLQFELGQADKERLDGGEILEDAVRQDLGAAYPNSKGRVSGRCMITLEGRRLSCLTEEEEERYLYLEECLFGDLTYNKVARWGGWDATKGMWQTTTMQKSKLAALMAQEDVLRALGVAEDVIEGALRDSTNASYPKDGQGAAHLAGQGPPAVTAAPSASREQPADPLNDARQYVNKFVPRMLDALPPLGAAPSIEEPIHAPYPDNAVTASANWQFNLSQEDAEYISRFAPETRDARAKAHQEDREKLMAQVGPAGRAKLQAYFEANPVNPLVLDLPVPVPSSSAAASSSSVAAGGFSTEASTTAAMDTLKEAMATAGAIAKLGASEALKNSADVFKQWDKAVAGSGMPKHLQNAMEKMLREVGGGKKDNSAMSMAELERESLRERIAEAKKEALEWEKRVNKAVRANRKLVIG